MLSPSITFKQNRRLKEGGITITIGPKGFNVKAADELDNIPLIIEIYQNGLLKKQAALFTENINDFLGDLDPVECGVRVLNAGTGVVLASLDADIDPYPFMRLQGEQKHITENYVSIPPALTITDEQGQVWTLGMTIAPKHQSPDGEFAFEVLRNGVSTNEIASRIERRNGKIKIFTVAGWKVWTGTFFF